MNLQLSLKTNWFKMTKANEKTEDYRDVTIYWFKRLVVNNKQISFSVNSGYGFIKESEVLKYLTEHPTCYQFMFKEFKTNTMTLGYPKKTDFERILKLEHKGIEIRTGNPEWGAEPNKLYFVIKHGKPLE